MRFFKLVFLSLGLIPFSISCSEERDPMLFCGILGVAEAYQDNLTSEVATRELQALSLSENSSCRSIADEAKEIGYNRLLTGEDLTPEASETMDYYLKYKNAILDSLRISLDKLPTN